MRSQPSRRKQAVRFVVEVDSGADLLQIVGALRPAPGFPSGLDRRQQETDQHADDGDHHQQFNQGESGSWTMHGVGRSPAATRPRTSGLPASFDPLELGVEIVLDLGTVLPVDPFETGGA